MNLSAAELHKKVEHMTNMRQGAYTGTVYVRVLGFEKTLDMAGAFCLRAQVGIINTDTIIAPTPTQHLDNEEKL